VTRERAERKGPRLKPRRGALPTFGLTKGQALALFLGALAIRLAHVLFMRESPYFDHPVIDALTYHQAATSIAAGHGHPDRVFWQPPGYAYFLALLYALRGSADFLLPRIVQSLIGASCAVLTAWIGASRFGARVGLAAGWIVAAYGTLVYFDGELLGASLTLLLQLVAVALAVLAAGEKRPERVWLAAGLATGCAALVTATSLVLAPIFAVAARRNWPAVLLGAAIAIAPATIRNAVHGGEFVPLSSNGGINLHIGNNAHYDETVEIRPDRLWVEFTKEPFEHDVRTQGGASLYWTGRVVKWAVEEPVAFLALQARKARLFLGGDEIYRNQAIYPARENSPVLRALLWKLPGFAFPYGLLAPFALVGMAVAWRRAPLLAAITVAYSLAVIAFFIAARYRVPLVPYFAIFAVQGAVWFGSGPPIAARAAAVGALVALLAVANLGQGEMSHEMNADAEFNLGDQFRLERNYREAEAHMRNALQSRPDYVEAWVHLGVMEAMQGRYDEAERDFEEAVRLAPEEPTTLLNYATMRERQNRWEEAAVLYERAASADPSDPFASGRLAEIRARGLASAR
jgi:tetratricopeptide (TPR) repeat protein